MTAHSYSLRSRISSSSLSNNKSPIHSPASRASKSPRKGTVLAPALQLRHVIGTTTSTPGGLSCCMVSNSYAYCAGSVAVLADIDVDNVVTHRYFKARPTVVPVNPITSFYDSPLSPNIAAHRRTTVNVRRGHDEGHATVSGRDWFEDSGTQTWSARERIKAVTCVSISPDGKMLAVGEYGYNPRILLFSTAADAPTDTPLSVMTDHTIGVRNVSFSPNSRYLATLGDVNDGFLYIWQINTKTGVVKLHSSNKCTTNVCDMVWCGDNVITVGTRHIKIWQPTASDDASSKRRTRAGNDTEAKTPGPIPLQGRNCLLGSLVDATFTTIVAITEDQAIVCADDGHICLLDLRRGRTELVITEKFDFTIAAITYRRDSGKILWSGDGGILEERDASFAKLLESAQETNSISINSQRQRRISRQSLLHQSEGLSPLKRAHVVAVGCLHGKLVSIDAGGLIRVSKLDTHEIEEDVTRFSSHNSLVRGIQRLPQEGGLGSFFTWARNGEIRFWRSNGEFLRVETTDLDENLDVDDAVSNELKTVRYCRTGRVFITGDLFGVVRMIEDKSWDCQQSVRAHSAEINGIDIHESSSMVATCSRDRMVQIFRLCNTQLELLQTSDDHISVVSEVLFTPDGNRLLSCSADRTIVVRERIERKYRDETVSAFVAVRTITMKAAPLSMRLMPFQASNLVIATMDRHILKIDFATGVTLSSFKVSDRGSDDTVMLNSICLSTTNTTNSSCLLAGYSAIDKSVRLYDLEKGVLLGRDSGHTEGISDIIMFEEEPVEGSQAQLKIVSTGLDSTIMIWLANAVEQPLLTPQQELSLAHVLGSDPEKSSVNASPVSLPPLRKILSKMDIAEFARQVSPTREVSPNGLRRKTSRLALTTSIDEVDEDTTSKSVRRQSQEATTDAKKRSPSPPCQATVKLKKQRSRPDINKRKSPSPTRTPLSVPSTPKHSMRANNSRLRRPPSIPNDLRAQASVQIRRQSMSSTNDFGSIGMASEQACRMLRIYTKKLLASKSDLDLDEMEAELEIVLKIVRQKKARTAASNEERSTITKEKADDEMNTLSVLLEKTSVS